MDITDRSMKLMTTALDMEEKGQKHYAEAALICRNALGREVFSLLSDYEVRHMVRIKEIYTALKGGSAWTEGLASFVVPSDLTDVFRILTQKHKPDRTEADEKKAIDIGMEFESASIKFYHELGDLSADPLEKKFADLMVAEERGHLNLLADLKAYYEDPEGWFMAKDRAGLDGA
ncbi:MAG: ferritin family protein [Deltaproteobacteria bacterium]|nr:ferritin family protein [Deltaproteobacteria bacterium]